MEILPIHTDLLKAGDDLADVISRAIDLVDGDIVIVSSKAIASVEGSAIRLSTLTVSEEAKSLERDHRKSSAYYQAVLNETKRMNGTVIQSVQGIVLTELKPQGLTGTILVPNAGLDRSNIDEGFVIGWPEDPVASACALRKGLPANTGVIVTDSGLCPRRTGVMAFALCTSGIDPLKSLKGAPDLFGNALHITEEAIADQLATAANFLMGNADQSTPAAVIRGHGLRLSDTEGWVPGIEREKDIYHGVI